MKSISSYDTIMAKRYLQFYILNQFNLLNENSVTILRNETSYK